MQMLTLESILLQSSNFPDTIPVVYHYSLLVRSRQYKEGTKSNTAGLLYDICSIFAGIKHTVHTQVCTAL